MLIYADTSLLLPIYVPEARSSEADEILESASTVVISDLTVAEFYVSLVRKQKLGTIKPENATVVREAFEEHMADDVLRREPFGVAYFARAGELAVGCSIILRTLDALHIAVALDLGATLATFDKRMADGARSLGLDVVPSPTS